MHILMLSADEDLSNVTAPLVGQVALVASEVGWLGLRMFKVFTVSLTVETLYLGLSLTTEPFLNHAMVGTGLPLCEHVKTASEARVTT